MRKGLLVSGASRLPGWLPLPFAPSGLLGPSSSGQGFLRGLIEAHPSRIHDWSPAATVITQCFQPSCWSLHSGCLLIPGLGVQSLLGLLTAGPLPRPSLLFSSWVSMATGSYTVQWYPAPSLLVKKGVNWSLSGHLPSLSASGKLLRSSALKPRGPEALPCDWECLPLALIMVSMRCVSGLPALPCVCPCPAPAAHFCLHRWVCVTRSLPLYPVFLV